MATLYRLNENATRIFCTLLDRVNQTENKYLKLKLDSFLPLSFEFLYDGVTTPWGEGKMYSLMHSYELNGDLMRDPDITFIVVDNRSKDNDLPELVGIYPQSYQQDALSLYQESIIIEDCSITKFRPNLNKDHCSFCN